MDQKTTRLFFIDALRAWAIIMMLQGHFIDGLLEPFYRQDGNLLFSIWKYFRGITAPVFFTVSGFIFTYLLVRSPQHGWQNPRVKKGIKRGLELVFIGYLLRSNIFGLLQGKVFASFFLVDVLHCIGLSLLAIIGLYLLGAKLGKKAFPALLIGCTLLLFLFEPWYKAMGLEGVPQWIANYLTKANGSVFTIIPWMGYTTMGGFMAMRFHRHKEQAHLYTVAIPVLFLLGSLLLFGSSPFFVYLGEQTGISLFMDISVNNYLFIRLGDVFLVFALFLLGRNFLNHPTLLRIGQSTLSIYVVHFIILYGSFTGLGLYRFFHHQLHPAIVVPGAVLFIIACCFFALRYERHKDHLTFQLRLALNMVRIQAERFLIFTVGLLRELVLGTLRLFGMVKN
jgi:uncharacterized membrane protein